MQRIKFGVVGSGLMAKIYSRILIQRDDCELVAITGNRAESTHAMQSEFKVPSYEGGNTALMLKNHPNLDALIVATPEWVRTNPVKTVVEAGKHLILEKPFADSWPVALELQKILNSHKKYLGLCHVLRHSPRFHGAYKTIQAGKVGEVRQIFARRNSNKKRVHRVLGKTDLCYWLSPHDVDMMRWMTGSEVKEIMAFARNGAKVEDDYLTVHLRFENRVDAVLEISWCSPPVSGVATEARFEVRGTEGTLELNDADMNVTLYREGNSVDAVDTYEDFDIFGVRGGMFANLMEHFVREIKSGKTDGHSLNDGLQTALVAAMIRKSLDESRLVNRSEFV